MNNIITVSDVWLISFLTLVAPLISMIFVSIDWIKSRGKIKLDISTKIYIGLIAVASIGVLISDKFIGKFLVHYIFIYVCFPILTGIYSIIKRDTQKLISGIIVCSNLLYAFVSFFAVISFYEKSQVFLSGMAISIAFFWAFEELINILPNKKK